MFRISSSLSQRIMNEKSTQHIGKGGAFDREKNVPIFLNDKIDQNWRRGREGGREREEGSLK